MAPTMPVDSLTGYFQRGHISAVAFYSEPGASQAAALTEILSTLVRETSSIDPTGRLQIPSDPVQRQNSPILQFVQLANELLTFSEITPSLRSKLQLLLFNLCQYNVRLRRYFSGELNLVNGVCFGLKISLQEQLGPQNLIDILRLLQVLTYEKCLNIGSWLNDLLPFLLGEMLRPDEAEWLPYCVAILSNLVNRSKNVSRRILKNTSTLNSLKKQLRKFLSHASQTVVVSSIVLVGYLSEEIRDIIFALTHISETFFCVFNVMKGGDTFMTRHVAIDLCRKLIIADNANVTFAPTLSSTAQNLTTYEFFTSSIQDIASQLVVLDYRTEECVKIYEFLIAVCGLPQLRSKVCLAILQTEANQKRLTTPILAMSGTAGVSFEDAIDPEAPLLAAELLTIVLKEAVDSNLKLDNYIPTDVLVGIVRNNVKTPIETKSEYVSYQCRRITTGLRLAEAIAGDEHIRPELFEAIKAPLCGHVNESQLLSNPIVAYMAKPPGQRGVNDLPEWSRHGVTIPLELLQLLASLKDFNKAYKELYWRSLKDERLIPFLAYAISYGDASTVFDALTLFTHCTQLQDFRTKLLSDLIASCAITKSRQSSSSTTTTAADTKSPNASIDNGDGISLASSQGSNSLTAAEVDRFLDRLRNNIDHHEPKLSQIVQIFERKIAQMTERQYFLENTIKEKEAALSLAHRQASNRTNNVDTTEMAKFRSILTSLETKQAEIETEKLALQSEKEMLARELAKQSLSFDNLKNLFETSRKTVESLQNDKAVLMDENQKEREVQKTLRDKFNEMTNKFDQATNAVFEKDRELVEMIERHEQLKREHESKNAENEAEIAKLKNENANLLAFKERMTKMINGEM